jgi:hypothetical protein
MVVHGSRIHILLQGQPLRNDQQDALCLRDELMELADEILEDVLNAPTSPERFNVQKWNEI